MSDDGPKKTPFEDFLIGEYTNLAQAFFSAATGITQFFQYYLLALGVPITAAGVVIKVSSGTLDLHSVSASSMATPLGWFFIIIGLVGVCMAAYIVNLRLDALLYARAVNGIRRYFYEKSGLSVEDQTAKYRLLPIELDRPDWFEAWFFLPVVIAFGLLNSAYFTLGLMIFGHYGACLLISTFLGSLGAHILMYGVLAGKRKEYLR